MPNAPRKLDATGTRCTLTSFLANSDDSFDIYLQVAYATTYKFYIQGYCNGVWKTLTNEQSIIVNEPSIEDSFFGILISFFRLYKVSDQRIKI